MSDNKQTKNGKAKEVIWISVITTLHGMNDDNLWTFGRNTWINFAWFLYWQQYFATQFLTHHLELTRHLCHSLSRGREMATISYRKKICTQSSKGRYIKYVLIMRTNGKHLCSFFFFFQTILGVNWLVFSPLMRIDCRQDEESSTDQRFER